MRINALLLLALASSAALGATPVDVYVNPLDYRDQVQELTVGQPAPPIKVTQWLHGPEHPTFLPGKTYVVEFWASWCGPCRKSIPHLVELQNKYRDAGVQVLGVAAAESEGPGELRVYLQQQGDAINYPIAYVEDKQVYEQWMQAGRTFGLPWVFIVDGTGRLAWWGQPFYAAFEPALDAIAKGEYEPTAQDAKRLANRNSNDETWRLSKVLDETVKAERWSDAVAIIDRLTARDAERFWWERVQKLDILLTELGWVEAALVHTRELFDSSFYNNPHGMMAIGDTLVDAGVSGEGLELALRAVERADVLTFERSAAVKSVAAKIACRAGHMERAAALTRDALTMGEPRVAASLLVDIANACRSKG